MSGRKKNPFGVSVMQRKHLIKRLIACKEVIMDKKIQLFNVIRACTSKVFSFI